jgi:triacylglycerol lipase
MSFRINGGWVILILSAVGFVHGGCRERRAGNADLTGVVTDNPTQDHPCSIAGHKTAFIHPPFTPIDETERILTRREWSVIRSNAMLSRLAYETPNVIDTTARGWGYKTIDVTVEGPMQAFVASNERCVVLSFRGTDMNSLRDWFIDAAAARRAVGRGMMHSGFHRAYQSMAGRLAVQLDAHGARTKSFWVTGHSLGGALAGVFAYSNKFSPVRRSFEIERVMTFGQPLFVDGPLAAIMRKEFLGSYFRVVNGKDIVARVPNWFEHFGSLVWIRPEGSEFHGEYWGATGMPGGNQDPVAIPARIPEEISSTEDAFNLFMRGEQPAPPPVGQPGSYGGLKIAGDHSMDLYLDRVTQKWNLAQ